MEQSIKQFSKKPAVRAERKKFIEEKKLKKAVSFFLVLLLVFAVSYKISLHKKWVSYNEKYYEAFVKRLNITDANFDKVSGQGYASYKSDDINCGIQFIKPSKDKFDFRVFLQSQHLFVDKRDPPYYLKSEKDEDHYYGFDLYKKVNKDGSSVTEFTLNKFRNGSHINYVYYEFEIKPNGTFVFLPGSEDLTDEEISIVYSMEDDILRLKKIMDEEILPT